MSFLANPVCRSCGHLEKISVCTSVNVTDSPEMKAKVLSGELFMWQCPVCGTQNLMKYPFLYHDPASSLIIALSETPVSADDIPEGYVGRQVRTPGELIEKIKIFDAGLDDAIVEMCKYVTSRELGRQVDMKFFRQEGADGEMIFTYPEDGQMQMISVGFNVYEDCAGIAARNPSVAASVKGLAKVDSEWLASFFG